MMGFAVESPAAREPVMTESSERVALCPQDCMLVPTMRDAPVLVFFFTLLVYLILPTKNYLWDGVAFAFVSV